MILRIRECSREEVAAVLALMQGVPLLVVNLLYGSGLRISEAVRLRVHDIDFALKEITVRSGKGDKDRVTTFPVSAAPLLHHHLAGVKLQHERELAGGYGEVYLPYALARKYERGKGMAVAIYLSVEKSFGRSENRSGEEASY